MSAADLDEETTQGRARVQPSNPEDTAAGLRHLPPVLTTQEAASALRIGVREVRKLVDAGELPAARFGPRRVIRIARSTLVRVLRGQSRKQP